MKLLVILFLRNYFVFSDNLKLNNGKITLFTLQKHSYHNKESKDIQLLCQFELSRILPHDYGQRY